MGVTIIQSAPQVNVSVIEPPTKVVVRDVLIPGPPGPAGPAGSGDGGTTYDDTELRAEIATKQPLGDYVTSTVFNDGLATKQPVGDYATSDELTSGLATKQPLGDYPTNTDLAAELSTKQPAGDYATQSDLSSGLNTRQPIGDYATNDALTAGLATKQPIGNYVDDTDSRLFDARVPLAHTHTALQITDFDAAVDSRVQLIVGSAPAALDTLGELAAALGDDANFASTVTASLSNKVNKTDAWLPSGGVTVTIPDSNTNFARINIPDDGSATTNWPDRLSFYFNGSQTGYHNEYGELRARPGKNTTVPFRVMEFAGGTASNVNLLEVASGSPGTLWFGVSNNKMTCNVAATFSQAISAPNIGAKVVVSATPPSDTNVVWIDIS